VTSVGLSLPSIFTVSGTPVTTTGTLTGSLATQTANTIFAGPTAGIPAAPTFRSLVANDIPNLNASKITTGTLPITIGGTNGTATPTAGAVAYGTGSAYAFTTAGTSGQLLQSNGAGVPTWVNPPTFAGWGLTGNTGTVAGTNFIGTTEAQDLRIRTNNIERLAITSAGNVGIGITNPSARLQVLASGGTNPDANGILVANTTNSVGQDAIITARVAGTNAGDPYISFDIAGEAGYSLGIDNSDNNSFKLGGFWNGVDGNTLLTIQSGGNLGIGTTTPSQRLDVSGNIRFSGALMSNNLAGTTGQILTSQGAGVAPVWSNLSAFAWSLTGNAGTNPLTNYLGTSDAQPLNLRTNSQNRISISETGRVNILESGVFEDYSLRIQANQTAGLDNGILINRNSFNNFSNASIAFKTFTLSGDSSSGIISLKNDQLLDRGLQFITTTGGLPANAILFSFLDPTTARVMSILRNGNTAIGNVTPTERLHVAGNIRFSGALMPNNTAGTAGQVLTSAGAGLPPTWAPAGGSGWGLTGNAGTNPATNFIGTTDAQPLRFATGVGGVERMRIDAIGRVGIGSTIPTSLLGVYGGIPPTASLNEGVFMDIQNTLGVANHLSGIRFKVNSSTANERFNAALFYRLNGSVQGELNFAIKANSAPNISANEIRMTITELGNVGIGTTTPDQRLEVNGNMRIPDTDIFLRPASDQNHGLGWYGGGKLFNGVNVDGPVLYGFSGGGLGTNVSGTRNLALTWNSTGNVGIGTTTPQARMEVFGTTLSPTLASINNGVASLGAQRLRFSTGDVIDFGFQSTPQYAAWMQAGFNGTAEAILLNPLGGNVGIGIGNPTARVHINATGGSNPDQNGLYVFNASNSAGQDAILTTRVAGPAAGNPFVSFDVSGEAGFSIGIDNADANKLKFSSNWSSLSSSTRMTIDQSGNVGIGTSTPTTQGKFHVSLGDLAADGTAFYGIKWVTGNTMQAHMHRWGASNNALYVTNAGTNNLTGVFLATNATSWTSSSDRRLKENIVETTYGLNEILKLSVKEYNFKTTESKDKRIGFLAQEVYQVIPEIVHKGDDGEYRGSGNAEESAKLGFSPWGLDYTSMIPVLVKATQELHQQMEQLKKTSLSTAPPMSNDFKSSSSVGVNALSQPDLNFLINENAALKQRISTLEEKLNLLLQSKIKE
jgi:hypothetical protein